MVEEETACRQPKAPEPEVETPLPVLTRQAILEIDDLKMERFDVPEWGGAVYLRVFSGKERKAWEDSIPTEANQIVDGLLVITKLVVWAACDETGTQLFTDADIPALQEKSAAALLRVYGRARRLNALTEGDVQGLAKNSESGLSDDSGSN